MDAVQASSRDTDAAMKESMKSFVNSCRQMLLYTEKDNIANQAALHIRGSTRNVTIQGDHCEAGLRGIPDGVLRAAGLSVINRDDPA